MGHGKLLLAAISIGFLSGPAGAESDQGGNLDIAVMPAHCHADGVRQGVPKTFAPGAEIIQPELVERVEPLFQTVTGESASDRAHCATFVYSVSAAGAVEDIELVYHSEAPNAFIVAAQEALSQWQFMPGRVDQEQHAFAGYVAAFYISGPIGVAGGSVTDQQAMGGALEAEYLDGLEAQILTHETTMEEDGVPPEPIFLADQVSPFVAAMVHDGRAEPVSSISTPLSQILGSGQSRPVADINAMPVSEEPADIDADILFPSLFAE